MKITIEIEGQKAVVQQEIEAPQEAGAAGAQALDGGGPPAALLRELGARRPAGLEQVMERGSAKVGAAEAGAAGAQALDGGGPPAWLQQAIEGQMAAQAAERGSQPQGYDLIDGQILDAGGPRPVD